MNNTQLQLTFIAIIFIVGAILLCFQHYISGVFCLVYSLYQFEAMFAKDDKENENEQK